MEAVETDLEKELQKKTFAAWPKGESQVSAPALVADQKIRQYRFSPQEPVELSFLLAKSDREGDVKSKPLTIVLSRQTREEQESLTAEDLKKLGSGDVILFSPRGLGSNAWSGDEKAQTHIRRRFALLGQTLDGMRLWDVCQLIRSVQQLPEYKDAPIHLKAEGDLAGIALYVPLFGPEVKSLELTALPASHHDGPEFLNVLKTLDLPQALTMASEQSSVVLENSPDELTGYLKSTSSSLKKKVSFLWK